VAGTLSSLQKYGEKAVVDAWWLIFPFQNIPPCLLGQKVNSKLERCLTNTEDMTRPYRSTVHWERIGES
jgi:hypothetical protein